MGQDALASVSRGEIGEVSVCFWSEVEEWDDTPDLPRRLITQADLIDVSLVLSGAYGKATSATMSGGSGNVADRRRGMIEQMVAAQRLRGIR